MDDKSSNVRSNFIKGDLAESIVARLFESLGFHLTYNGMEVTNPELLLLQKKRLIQQSDIAKYRAKSDLIAIREKTAQIPGLRLDLEVKFSIAGEIPTERIMSYDEDAHFIFVDTENFWSVSKQNLRQQNRLDEKVIMFRTLTKLEEEKTLGLSTGQKQIVQKYKPFLAALGSLTALGQHRKPTKPSTKVFPQNHGGIWSGEHLKQLPEEFFLLSIRHSRDEVIELLAKMFDRTENGILRKLEELGLIPRKSDT